MALSKSVATVIQENENWLRLGTFLHDPLKNAFLSVLHNSANDVTYIGLPDDPFLLHQEFSKHQNLIAQLVQKRVLQKDQVELLLPPNSNQTDSSTFDITLSAILIRNFTTLKPPVNGWKDKCPPANDRSKGAGVIRGREWRNFVHHTDPKDIDQVKFNQKWTEGTQIIHDLGYNYDTNKLKTISLDPKHEAVCKSLNLLITNLETKVDSLEAKHSKRITGLDSKVDSLEAKHSKLINDGDTKVDSNCKLISNLKQQVNKISNEVQHFHQHKEIKDYSNKKSSSCCLKSVLEYISREINEKEAEELVERLHIQAEADLVDKLKSVTWEDIKRELKMLGRADVIEYIRKNTLITRGLQNASDELRNHYKTELINCLVEQPLSSIEMDSRYISREDIYVDLAVLPASTVDEEWSNSDRDALMKQILLDKSSTVRDVDKLIEPQDEMVFMRGVAGTGKSTLIDMFTLKWAKNELSNPSIFDLVLKFNCRELNQNLNELRTLEQLFELQYPEIFCIVTLKDLAEISDRVLIIVDGVDELKDIYQMDGLNASSAEPFHQVLFDLLNPKSMKTFKHHKTIVCGRPKACEFVKNQISQSKIKTVEVCGFSHINVQRYILKCFKEDEIKAKKVQNIIASSYNLKVMSTVPVLLWVICNVYSEDLIQSPINTNTELYFYACLVFLRNHFQGFSERKNLLDIVNDQDIIDVVYSLMVLSVKTYMQNQVLFTDEDIKNLKCSVHLEQTGFIVKYSLSNLAKSTYQFRHLILQEFLCGMYLCVTKGISPFLSNRELSSCLPTIYGIDRIIKEKENETFLDFYNALLKSNKKLSNIFTKLSTPFRIISFKNFLIKKFRPPRSMIHHEILRITDKPECREFLDLFKETNNTVAVPFIKYAVIYLEVYKDFKNILNLLENLHITKIKLVKLTSNNLFDESGKMDENYLRFYEMTQGGLPMVTRVYFLISEVHRMVIKNGELSFSLHPSFPLSLPDIIKMKSNSFEIEIENDVVLHHHDIVPGFLQDLTKYAIKHCKKIKLVSNAATTCFSIDSILKDANINLESQYLINENAERFSITNPDGSTSTYSPPWSITK